MQKIRAVIIEDEPQAREMLTTLVEDYCQEIHIIGSASNVQEGVAAIKKLVPDLVFLDIEMPNEKGLELFKYFDKIDFEVIFTTAYDQYAIDALRLSALDYLLKPIDLKDLRTA
jgi:two-component system LytT family response regulator